MKTFPKQPPDPSLTCGFQSRFSSATPLQIFSYNIDVERDCKSPRCRICKMFYFIISPAASSGFFFSFPVRLNWRGVKNSWGRSRHNCTTLQLVRGVHEKQTFSHKEQYKQKDAAKRSKVKMRLYTPGLNAKCEKPLDEQEKSDVCSVAQLC